MLRYYSGYEKSLILKHISNKKEELKRIKATFISEPLGNICGGLKDICPKKPLPNQASELTAGSFGGCCKPPVEIQEVEFEKNVEINAS